MVTSKVREASNNVLRLCNFTHMKYSFAYLYPKVERDIKTTFKTGDFVKRKIAKETKSVITSVTKISKPLLSLPSTIQRLRLKHEFSTCC